MDSKNTIDSDAKTIALEMGNIPKLNIDVQAAIQQLNRKGFIPLNLVQIVHDWLEGKRQSRQSGRVVGESRTGTTMACDAYRLRHTPLLSL